MTTQNVPHHKLKAFQEAAEQRNLTITGTAKKGAGNLGLDSNEIYTVISELRAADFKKSMTSYNDHSQWQDVYNTRWARTDENGALVELFEIYIKFTDVRRRETDDNKEEQVPSLPTLAEFTLLSFKENDR